MSITQDRPRYRALLLTLWEERSQDRDAAPVWRFRLENPRTGQCRGFADLAALVEALKEEMASYDEK